MPEIWLRLNRRPLAFGLIVPSLLTLGGVLMAAGSWGLEEVRWVRMAGALLAAGGGIVLLSVIRWARRPLLAYQEGTLLAYLRTGRPIRIPLEFVEGFLLGKEELELPGDRRVEAQALVVRLAEKAEDWQQVEIHPTFGRWCGGYLTIRGTWCEPLSVALVNRLNARLAEVQREYAVPRGAA